MGTSCKFHSVEKQKKKTWHNLTKKITVCFASRDYFVSCKFLLLVSPCLPSYPKSCRRQITCKAALPIEYSWVACLHVPLACKADLLQFNLCPQPTARVASEALTCIPVADIKMQSQCIAITRYANPAESGPNHGLGIDPVKMVF